MVRVILQSIFLRLIWAVCFFLFSAGAFAGLQEGLDAYQRGDYAAAQKELAPLGVRGVAAAQLYLGMMSENGQGVPQNYAKAAMQYEFAANQGNVEAQRHLGMLYDLGKGVPQDKKIAAEWYRKSDEAKAIADAKATTDVKAAEADANAPEQVRLQAGLDAYLVGDYSLALKEFVRLADKGNAIAQFSLGVMHELGQGVPQNYKKTALWYRKAVDQGYVEAQHNLGVMYDLEKDVPLNYKLDTEWYRKATEQEQENLKLVQSKDVAKARAKTAAEAEQVKTEKQLKAETRVEAIEQAKAEAQAGAEAKAKAAEQTKQEAEAKAAEQIQFKEEADAAGQARLIVDAEQDKIEAEPRLLSKPGRKPK